jgi:NAD(P)-dependent dehydrogenase (short-subunit alcohol dehydrogenase family)
MSDAPTFSLPADALGGKVAVIIGASRGLGAGLAARFVEHGLRGGLCARTAPTAPSAASVAAVDHFTAIVAVEEPALVCHAVAPGVVDTDMQAQIRTHDAATFPAIERFRELHRDGTWRSPAWVADHLLGILAGPLTPPEVVYRVPNER